MKIDKDIRKCFGYFMDCGLCKNHQRCFDLDPESPLELKKNCDECWACEESDTCGYFTFMRLASNRYTKTEIIMSVIEHAGEKGFFKSKGEKRG